MCQLISGSVRQVILDAKVGPPLHEKGLAKDIISVVSSQYYVRGVFVFFSHVFGWVLYSLIAGKMA